ncbi:Peptidase family M23 [Catalinimonas alkaloidigena]|uniref:Peptidase family M23 n=1 Tax=Catalinimonas alkaloidigena TaxID=1075417 RepID=A0A1G9K6D9_9BACT|nr:M23 family metallopeptidase [Catalinimonas alkaloidigena]SDL44984.1 Peptidase family M23 [Catalinimonas alkaloidigena]
MHTFGRSPLFRVFFVFAVLLSGWSLADTPEVPRGYFLYPIKPGQPSQLAGSMGEIRPNHFHGGLDIKTDQRTGLPVYASAEGYVYRVRVGTSGYGNAIYLRHPNGLRTVYAHLDSFYDELADYVRAQQYNEESFEINLFPGPKEFVVKRGQIIAASGNSGSSGGPHLHFEIRDSNEAVLNPLQYGFDEVRDQVPPVFRRIALRALSTQSRINGSFGDFEAVPLRRGHHYYLNDPVQVHGLMGLEVDIYDQQNGSANRNGVQCVEVKVDGKEVYTHHIDRFTFDQNHTINVHVNYEAWQGSGRPYQRCYVADGNDLGFYHTPQRDGKILIDDNRPHQVEVKLWDTYQNMSQFSMTLQGVSPEKIIDPVLETQGTPTFSYELHENLLKVTARHLPLDSRPAIVYAGNNASVLPPAYANGASTVFLYDMRQGLPDSLDLNGDNLELPYCAAVPAGVAYQHCQKGLDLSFGAGTLYDTLYLTTRVSADRLDICAQQQVPLAEAVEVVWHPEQLPSDLDKTVVYMQDSRGRKSFEGGTWKEGAIHFRTRRFGSFVLATDDNAPSVRLLRANHDEALFRIRDDLAGIASFRATVDGKWLLMNYDYKTGLLKSEKKDSRLPLRGELVLEVTDQVGNRTTFRQNL